MKLKKMFIVLSLVIVGTKSFCQPKSPQQIQFDVRGPEYVPGYQDHVTDGNITWYFDKQYPVGTFANGDWWVAGDTVVINRITPDFVNGKHGWEVNPVVEGGQGFCSEVMLYDAKLVPSLPYIAKPISSIVKTIRSDVQKGVYCRQCIQTAAVLTVVSQPLKNSNSIFRPTYIGLQKIFYSIESLKFNLLPKYGPVANTPSISSFSEIMNLQLRHKNATVGGELIPIDACSNDYGSYIGTRNADIALRLMLNDPIEEKKDLLIAYVQYGIDLIYFLKNGYQYANGGGHTPGLKLPMVFAAVMLGDESLINLVRTSTDNFYERVLFGYNHDSTIILWGDDQNQPFDLFESNYWKGMHSYITSNTSGYKSFKDPYGYIDGGPRPGTEYQWCCASQPLKGSVLAINLMDALYTTWNDTLVMNYVERWVTKGIWAQPDPCAPVDSNWNNYGITFGPDGNGGCIEDTDSSDGIGRFPKDHGTQKDEGHYSSNFTSSLWQKYYNFNKY